MKTACHLNPYFDRPLNLDYNINSSLYLEILFKDSPIQIPIPQTIEKTYNILRQSITELPSIPFNVISFLYDESGILKVFAKKNSNRLLLCHRVEISRLIHTLCLLNSRDILLILFETPLDITGLAFIFIFISKSHGVGCMISITSEYYFGDRKYCF